jgi:hypothetical protein
MNDSFKKQQLEQYVKALIPRIQPSSWFHDTPEKMPNDHSIFWRKQVSQPWIAANVGNYSFFSGNAGPELSAWQPLQATVSLVIGHCHFSANCTRPSR